MSFYNFYTERVRDLKIKLDKDRRFKSTRGVDRKRQNLIPDYKKVSPIESEINAVLDRAKSANRGVWAITKRQVVDISNKYKFLIPNDNYPTKHLGSTGIILWRKEPNKYYLIKRKNKNIKNEKLYKYGWDN
jgi:hypothetical protein